MDQDIQTGQDWRKEMTNYHSKVFTDLDAVIDQLDYWYLDQEHDYNVPIVFNKALELPSTKVSVKMEDIEEIEF